MIRKENIMERLVSYLKDNPVQYSATIGLDNKPKVRPFQFMFEEDGKIWFCTSNRKEVYRELENNPYIELSVMSGDYSWLRLSGKVEFSDVTSLKERVFEVSPLVKEIYKEVNNPDLEIFCLKEGSGTIFSIGKDPQKVL